MRSHAIADPRAYISMIPKGVHNMEDVFVSMLLEAYKSDLIPSKALSIL